MIDDLMTTEDGDSDILMMTKKINIMHDYPIFYLKPRIPLLKPPERRYPSITKGIYVYE